MLKILLLTGLVCLLLALAGSPLRLTADRRRLQCFTLQLQTEQYIDALTRNTLAEMRRAAREAQQDGPTPRPRRPSQQVAAPSPPPATWRSS
jgi:hypothetical protein